MRKLITIDQDIERCKEQIATVYDQDNFGDPESLITQEGFRIQLHKLIDERNKTQSLLNIEIINPRLLRG